MNKEFIPYKQALALKVLGFDEPCFTFYPKEGKMGFDGKYHSIKEGYKNSTVNAIWIKRYKKDFGCVTAPTYSQAFRWFREKYNLWGMIYPRYGWNYSIQRVDETTSCTGESFHGVKIKSYEEAELACLKKLIEIVKDGTKINTRED